MLVEPILADLDFTGGDGVLAFVNGMGGTPLIELYLMYDEVAAILEKAGVTVARSLVGPYITSLDMAGCSVTLLQARRRAAAAVGRAGAHRRPALGRLSVPGQRGRRARSDRWVRSSPRRHRRAHGPADRSSTPPSATPTTAPTWTAA